MDWTLIITSIIIGVCGPGSIVGLMATHRNERKKTQKLIEAEREKSRRDFDGRIVPDLMKIYQENISTQNQQLVNRLSRSEGKLEASEKENGKLWNDLIKTNARLATIEKENDELKKRIKTLEHENNALSNANKGGAND